MRNDSKTASSKEVNKVAENYNWIQRIEAEQISARVSEKRNIYNLNYYPNLFAHIKTLHSFGYIMLFFSLQIWERNWGELYGSEASDYKGKIQNLDDKISKLPVRSNMKSHAQQSYTWHKPYSEPKHFRIRSAKTIENAELLARAEKDVSEEDDYGN